MALATPFPSKPSRVRPEWIDHNGHMNLAYYVLLFDEATDALWQVIGLGKAYRYDTGYGTFAVEAHTLYVAELVEGDETEAASFVLGVDAKRLHVAHELCRARDGAVAARQELMYLTVDLSARRSVAWPEPTLAGLRAAVAGPCGVAAPRLDRSARRYAVAAARPGGVNGIHAGGAGLMIAPPQASSLS